MRAPKALSPRPCSGSRRCRQIEKGGFDPVHEDLCLTRPRHANDSLLLWQVLLYGRGERDHRHICLLRCAFAHRAYEGLSHTLIHSGGEEQKVCTIEQLVDNPCGVGIEESGLVTGALEKHRESARPPYRSRGWLLWLWVPGIALWVGSLAERSSGVFAPTAERAGALCPDPLVVVVCFTS
jgi:hypothetical protein